MEQTARPTDYEDQIMRLQREHQELKRRVSELHQRPILTPDEQRLVTDLKKKKLATKDAISGLQREACSSN